MAELSAKHPSFVQVHDIGTMRSGVFDVPYLVLEWVEGKDLEATLRARNVPYGEREAMTLLKPAVAGMAAAHGMHPPVAHRDLKSANVMVVETGDAAAVKIPDLGMAKVMQPWETPGQRFTRTSSGMKAFSPHDGAREQWNTKKFGATGPWTDVHAIGLMLVEMVTLRPPLEGNNEYELMTVATAAGRPTPRARGAQVSDEFEELGAKAIALRAEDRFRNASERLSAIG